MANPQRQLQRALSLLLILIASWLLWSGLYKPILLALGAFSCLLCVYLAKRTGFFTDATGLRLIPKLPVYWFWLAIEIVKSSFEVAKIVLSPKLPISPTVIEFEALPKGPIGQAILGNAITLSPGTVTLDVYQGRMQVHCLTKAGAADLLQGDANRRTAALTEE